MARKPWPGLRVKMLRRQAKVTQETLVAHCDPPMSVNTLQRIESQPGYHPRIDRLSAIVMAFRSLGISATSDYLLFGKGRQSNG
jgi:DNA-binding XRE family transcriptional regulator